MALADYIGRFWAGAEVIYGVIIAMTFTSALRDLPFAVLEKMLVERTVYTALFCCMAWGVADGLFYLWERNYLIRQENRIIELSKSAQTEPAVSLVEAQLDDTVLRNVPSGQRQELYVKLVQFLSGSGTRETLSWREGFTIVGGTFIRSALAGVVVVIPFFATTDVDLALKVSNLLGILLLFGIGYVRALDREFVHRIVMAVGTSMIGIVITAITVVLGG
ncbi:MAG: hypothetical protein LUQ42_04540 [Methanomicrobiales archaeon]|nr:hypothetical protein [Methanomicrobiales archaeon]MDD1648534.1 hypothetical protein [Methanomicrobiales archaeon]